MRHAGEAAREGEPRSGGGERARDSGREPRDSPAEAQAKPAFCRVRGTSRGSGRSAAPCPRSGPKGARGMPEGDEESEHPASVAAYFAARR